VAQKLQKLGKVATNFETTQTDLCTGSVCRLLLTTSTITICHYYSVSKLTIISSFDKKWRAKLT